MREQREVHCRVTGTEAGERKNSAAEFFSRVSPPQRRDLLRSEETAIYQIRHTSASASPNQTQALPAFNSGTGHHVMSLGMSDETRVRRGREPGLYGKV